MKMGELVTFPCRPAGRGASAVVVVLTVVVVIDEEVAVLLGAETTGTEGCKLVALGTGTNFGT